MNPVDQEGKVAYKLLLLSDGPCTTESFRPLEDKSQWWARRDALVRIIYAQNQGQNLNIVHPEEAFTYIMYHNGNPKTDDTSVSLMSLSVSGETQFSEEDIISAMKKASKQNQSNLRPESSRFVHGSSISCRFISNSNPNRNVTPHRSFSMVAPSLPENASKKEILSFLHLHSNLEHLRKHQLNASTEIVLKKKNMQQLKDAWQDWQNEVRTDPLIEHSESEFNEEENALIETYMQVFRTCTSWSQSPSTLSVLLLHEDYKYELPVFGDSMMSNLRVDGNHTVLYVLGAVRDMTMMESRCLLEASKVFGCSMVTANLGRTAEFTSKIVMALRGHALNNNRFFHAMSRLQQLQQEFIEGSELLQKLISIRGDHSTWDGYTTSKGENPNQDTYPCQQVHTPVTDIPIRSHSAQHIIVATCVPFAASSISLDLSRRSEYLPVLRLIVFTLWKSRVVCDQNDRSHEDTKDVPITNTLYLSFSCGLILKITQGCIAEEVMNHHCPAPSEYQLLSMLQRLVGKASCSSSVVRSEPILSSRSILKRIYKDIAEDSAQTIPDKIYTCSLSEPCSSLPCLTTVAYSLSCWCDGSHVPSNQNNNEGSNYLVLYLSSPCCSDFPVSCSSEKDGDIGSELPKKLYKKICKGFLGRLNIFNNEGHNLSYPFQICLLQHFSYHGLLFPSLGRYKRSMDQETRDHIDNLSMVEEQREEEQKKRSKKKKSKNDEKNEEEYHLKKKRKSSST